MWVSPGHGLDLQALLDAVGQRLLVVVFADTGQDSLLVGFILVTTGVDLAWRGTECGPLIPFITLDL